MVPQEISRFDDMFGWSLVPGARAVSKSTGQKIEYAINSKGFRDREYPLEKPAGTFRNLLLGVSHTCGFGIPWTSTSRKSWKDTSPTSRS